VSAVRGLEYRLFFQFASRDIRMLLTIERGSDS
jgi:hypothetical protein